ncbi:MAG: hypothetical protein J6B77_03905 [Clostridia bacterium]|nr:hypothetical protein [Clostridia bacterium]
MKKATLLTFLFAILMIALLVSCNTTPDPLPSGGETTTGDITEAGGEVTTAEPSGSGDDAVTTDATVTTEAITLPEIEEPVEVADTETPWYIIEWIENPRWKTDLAHWSGYTPVPEEKKDLAFQVPLSYESSVDGISLKAEFFQEFYRVGDLMQVRFTITNNRETDFTFHSNSILPLMISAREADGTEKKTGINIYPMADSEENEDPHYTWEYYMIETNMFLTVSERESFVLEYAVYIHPDFFDADSDYTLMFQLYEGTDPNYSYDPPHPFASYEMLDFGKYPARMVKITLAKQ